MFSFKLPVKVYYAYNRYCLKVLNSQWS